MMDMIAEQVGAMTKKGTKGTNEKRMAHPTIGFGVPVTVAPHQFVVTIPRGTRKAVHIVEDLGMHAQGDSPELLDRVVVPRPIWTEIANPVKRLFNQRLKSHNLKTSRWTVGENQVDRLLGKELCVLAWAVEDLDAEKVGAALRNWLSLRPEERWWLFGMTASTAGAPEDRGRGWRAALGYALGDTPESVIRKTRRSGTKHDPNNDQGSLPLFKD